MTTQIGAAKIDKSRTEMEMVMEIKTAEVHQPHTPAKIWSIVRLSAALLALSAALAAPTSLHAMAMQPIKVSGGAVAPAPPLIVTLIEALLGL
jgi:hypothetical protein